MNNNLGSNADDFFKNLAGQAWKSHREIAKQKDDIKLQKKLNPRYEKEVDKKEVMILYAIVLGIIAFVGIEPSRILLRKNIGEGVINRFRLFVACSFFFVFALAEFAVGFSVIFGSADDKELAMDNEFTYFLTGMLYIFLTFYPFSQLGKVINKAAPYGYTGDSKLELSKSWEPIIIILVGAAYSLLINILGGLPIIACGISMLVYTIMEIFFFGSHMQKTVIRRNMELNQQESFNDIDS